MRQGCQAMLQRRLITILLVTFLAGATILAMIVFRTAEHYSRSLRRIQNGMTESEVEGILGGPAGYYGHVNFFRCRDVSRESVGNGRRG